MSENFKKLCYWLTCILPNISLFYKFLSHFTSAYELPCLSRNITLTVNGSVQE